MKDLDHCVTALNETFNNFIESCQTDINIPFFDSQMKKYK